MKNISLVIFTLLVGSNVLAVSVSNIDDPNAPVASALPPSAFFGNDEPAPSALPPSASVGNLGECKKIVESPITIHLPEKFYGTSGGWAILSFDVSVGGVPSNIKIVKESQGGKFSSAAIETLKSILYNTNQTEFKNCEIALNYVTY